MDSGKQPTVKITSLAPFATIQEVCGLQLFPSPYPSGVVELSLFGFANSYFVLGDYKKVIIIVYRYPVYGCLSSTRGCAPRACLVSIKPEEDVTILELESHVL